MLTMLSLILSCSIFFTQSNISFCISSLVSAIKMIYHLHKASSLSLSTIYYCRIPNRILILSIFPFLISFSHLNIFDISLFSLSFGYMVLIYSIKLSRYSVFIQGVPNYFLIYWIKSLKFFTKFKNILLFSIIFYTTCVVSFVLLVRFKCCLFTLELLSSRFPHFFSIMRVYIVKVVDDKHINHQLSHL